MSNCILENEPERNLGKITFDSINYSIPKHYGLATSTKYVLSRFESNIYITTDADDPTQFKVDNCYGDPLDIMKEYIIIFPKY